MLIIIFFTFFLTVKKSGRMLLHKSEMGYTFAGNILFDEISK